MDPLSIGAGMVVKATDAGSQESAKAAGHLLTRLLGPAADEYGDQLREVVARKRAARAERLLSQAEAKSRGRAGSVPPRVAFRVLEDGTLSDDELMADYLSGVLAGSRSPGGRDDRAVVWSDLIARTSAVQLRAHFLLYREWHERLRGRTDLNLGLATDRHRARIQLDLLEFVAALQDPDSPLPADDVVSHVIWGLDRTGMIGTFNYGGRDADTPEPQPLFEYYLEAEPTVVGVELWGWAAGVPGLNVSTFVGDGPEVSITAPLPRLNRVAFPDAGPVEGSRRLR